MPDIKPDVAVADDQVRDFAETHDVSEDAARELIDRYGADNEELEAAIRNRTAH